MKNRIISKLREIEQAQSLEILFAVESGSRAWGFASPDSDFDLRFVYKRKPEAYLSLWTWKDTVQFMTEDDLDGSGWDLKKATTLLSKSNPSLLGWLFSPIVYMDNGETLSNMRSLAETNFNPVAGFFHYHNMNKRFAEQLQNGEIASKAFFYAARTALCANWILHFGTIPPVRFQELYKVVEPEYRDLLDDLILKKAELNESDHFSVDKRLLNFLKSIVVENEQLQGSIQAHRPNYMEFDQFFLSEVL